MLEVGIIGLPNVGKSTLLNALASAHARVSNFPFCTIEPNQAQAPVPDPRLDRVAEIFGQQTAIPAAVTFVDIAGLVRGASRGEGLGNQFLSHVRNADALLHVVRCFADEAVSHADGTLDAARDAETVDLELTLADLGAVQRRLERLAPKIRMRAKEALAEEEILRRLADDLDAGKPLRSLALSEHEKEMVGELGLLTAKPVLYIANMLDPADEQAESLANSLESYARARQAPVLAIAGKTEADLAELPEQERQEYIEGLGLDAVSLERVVKASYELLHLITFFTAVGKEARAWPLGEGSTVHQAAGKIHTDLAEGFIKAEVADFASLDRLGSWEEAHKQGLARIEGRDYIVRDGDVIHIRFHV
jgi:hypothetical protein